MKKLFAALLSSALVISMSAAPASATIQGNLLDPNKTSDQTSVIYTVDPAYMVMIPTKVNLGESASVRAIGVKVKKGSRVVVKLTDTSGTNGAFTVKTREGAELEYAINDGTKEISVNDTILSVNPENSADGSTVLEFKTKGTAQFAGEYEGTVTFSVAVEGPRT